jgi:hypothetical protein
MKLKSYKLMAIATAVAVLASIPFSVAAKENNKSDNSKKVEVKVEVKVVEKEKTSTPIVPKVEVKKEVKPTPAPKVTKKDTKASKEKKPQVKNGVLNQLTAIEKKLSGIEADTNKISVSIKAYVSGSTTGSAITTTPAAIDTTSGSAVTTTGSAIEVKEINKAGFINGTKGKLNALSNRLAEVEKSLKAIQNKVDKSSTAKYSSLVSKLSDVKAKISKEIGILKGLSIKK